MEARLKVRSQGHCTPSYPQQSQLPHMLPRFSLYPHSSRLHVCIVGCLCLCFKRWWAWSVSPHYFKTITCRISLFLIWSYYDVSSGLSMEIQSHDVHTSFWKQFQLVGPCGGTTCWNAIPKELRAEGAQNFISYDKICRERWTEEAWKASHH